MDGEIDWLTEAEAVIIDVQAHTKSIQVSSLPPPSTGIFLNITTIENQKFCVLLGPSGFKVVGDAHNNTSLESTNQVFFETPYALLSRISPSYSQSFGNLLINKLNEQLLNNNQL